MTIVKPIFSFISFSFLLFASFSCNKTNSFTEKELRGKLYLNDTILKKDILILSAGINIQLSRSENFSEYLYKTTTDVEGNFGFSYQPLEGIFYLLAKTTKDGVYYTSVVRSDTFINRLIMYPQINNAVKVIAKDSLGGVLSNANVCLFTSPVLFNKDSCEYAARTKLTNENGVAFFNETAPGTYYIRVKATYGSLKLKGSDIVTVTNALKSTQIECRQ